jgi:hypothetical protein
MCLSTWTVFLMEDGDPYEHDGELMEALNISSVSVAFAATISTYRKPTHEQARQQVCAVAVDWAARFPEHVDRVCVAQMYYCHGEEIDELLDRGQWERYAAEIS